MKTAEEQRKYLDLTRFENTADCNTIPSSPAYSGTGNYRADGWSGNYTGGAECGIYNHRL